MAGQNDGHAFADVFSIFTDGDLTNSDSFKQKLINCASALLPEHLPFTSRMEFFGPGSSLPGEYPRSLIVMRAILPI